MIDRVKHIEYWKNGSVSDMETAGILIDRKKHREGLFFCHLSVEKALKALYVGKKGEIPPKTHNLFQLAESIGVVLDVERGDIIGILMNYQLEGRYPDAGLHVPDEAGARSYFEKAGEVREWLIRML